MPDTCDVFKITAISCHMYPLHRQIMESISIRNSTTPLLNGKLEHAGCKIPSIQIEGNKTTVNDPSIRKKKESNKKPTDEKERGGGPIFRRTQKNKSQNPWKRKEARPEQRRCQTEEKSP